MIPIPEHAEFNEQLSASLDGALDDVTQRRLTAHLAACAICRLDLTQLRQSRAALQALPTLRAPRSFAISAEAAGESLARPVEMEAETGMEAETAGPVPGERSGRRGTRPASGPARPALAPWLVWAGRLGSFAAAACLLIAVVTATLPDPGAAGGEMKEVTQSAPAATSRDRLEASGTSVAGAAPASAFASGGTSGAPPGAAPAPPAPVADAGASQRVAPRARSVPGESVPNREPQTGPAAAPVRPSSVIWLALGGLLAIPSVALLFLDRRARRAA